MKVEVIYTNGWKSHCYENIWEIQDNGHKEIVLKKHDHSCIRINEEEISKINVELES